MDLSSIISSAGAQRSQSALERFLKSFLDPAFGALPKFELELKVLELLIELGAISPRPGIYELVSTLKITRAKARKLIYERELRSRSPQELDEELRLVLARPLLLKRGEVFALEIENPLLADHLRARLQSLGHASDGSFSPSLVTLSLDAMVVLIESELSEAQRIASREALIAAGAPDQSFKGVLKAALKKLGEKFANEAGAAVASEASEYFAPLLQGSREAIAAVFKSVFSTPGG